MECSAYFGDWFWEKPIACFTLFDVGKAGLLAIAALVLLIVIFIAIENN